MIRQWESRGRARNTWGDPERVQQDSPRRQPWEHPARHGSSPEEAGHPASPFQGSTRFPMPDPRAHALGCSISPFQGWNGNWLALPITPPGRKKCESVSAAGGVRYGVRCVAGFLLPPEPLRRQVAALQKSASAPDGSGTWGDSHFRLHPLYLGSIKQRDAMEEYAAGAA